MDENYKLKELTLEELQVKHKKLQHTVKVIGIIMIIAQAILLFIAVKDGNYSLLLIVVLGAILPGILPIITPLKKIETEIKSRNSQS
jgi:hypothetical protein